MTEPLNNERHEHFAQLVASGVSPAKAYVSVGYSKGGAGVSACRLLRDARISARVRELANAKAERAIEKAAVDRARVLHRLDELSKEAQQEGRYSAAVRAEELLGKELGMFVERSQSEITMHGGLSLEAAIEAGHRRAQAGIVEQAGPVRELPAAPEAGENQEPHHNG